MLKYIEKNKTELIVISAVFIIWIIVIYLFFTIYEVCDPPILEETPQLTPVMQKLLDELEKKFK
jgi:hypothetical protein